MHPKTFQRYRELIHSHSGIDLSPGKEALVSSRLAKRIRELGLQDEIAYLDYLASEESIDELTRLIDMMSTNVTSFLRESTHFELIDELLRNSWRRGPQPILLWSAACSSGQEPYTLAMVASEAAIACRVDPKLVKILATDISTEILQKAESGLYSERELQGVPKDWLKKYFRTTTQAGHFQTSDAIRAMVTFRRLNLSKTPYPMQGPFDAVFCRNVMIYFDNEVRTRIVSEASRLLRPGGLFLIGHSENLTGIPTSLKITRPTVYQRAGGE